MNRYACLIQVTGVANLLANALEDAREDGGTGSFPEVAPRRRPNRAGQVTAVSTRRAAEACHAPREQSVGAYVLSTAATTKLDTAESRV